MNVELWPVAKIIPYARNARKISQKSIDKVAASIHEFGWRQPVVVDAEGVIIAGHTRLLAAHKLCLEQVPVHVAANLTPAQVRAYRLMDNRSNDEAEWDFDLLAPELLDLQGLDFDLDLTGFDQDEIAGFLAKADAAEGLTDEDAVPAAPEFPVTEQGDLWILGRHRLLCGDSTSIDAVERLMDGQKADMLFTDPPYGVNYEGGHFHSGDVNIKRKRDSLQADESAQIYSDFLPVAVSHIDGPGYMWFAHSKGYDVFKALHENDCTVSAVLVWHKTNATYAAMNAQYKQRHEPCVYFKPRGSTLRWTGAATESTLWEEKRDAQNTMHPTQKPVCLAERAINNHKVNAVLDLFGGSGSTLIACEKTGRNARLMEIEPKYCDVIIKRWQDFTGKQAKLDSDGRSFDEIASQRKPVAA